ncbi:uncharacterized protein Dyak_GE27905 [Drosophila yakuba]|uniref:Uncharacterized protein n=1 Tax=Drosophila yakuba TaxID=7245 RepID=A0A0R1E8D7_DROYA|nr:uncharacterized protein Dyak_GE27905 [Drosophila yakuba]
MYKIPGGRQEGQYHYDDIKPIPFSTVHMDHLGNEHILVLVDAFTKFTILLYGYEPRDVLENTLTSVIQNQDQGMMTDAELEKLRADAANIINDHRAVAKMRYDAAHSKPTV